MKQTNICRLNGDMTTTTFVALGDHFRVKKTILSIVNSCASFVNLQESVNLQSNDFTLKQGEQEATAPMIPQKNTF